MLINEVSIECQLTRKAIDYYVEQELVQPKILDNGYRDFSDQQVELLKKIAIMRKLGFTISDIRSVLNSTNNKAIIDVASKKEIELESMKAKQELTQQLAHSQDWAFTHLQLEALEQKQTIAERLLIAFPGFYGNYLSLHFGSFLNEPLISSGQQEAYHTIITFLDDMNLSIPTDIQAYFDESTKHLDSGLSKNISNEIKGAIKNPEKYMTDNQEILDTYLKFLKSDEYKNSPAQRLREFFLAFTQESGYYDIFIPAMKQLSPSYQDYQETLLKANEVFIEKFPDNFL